MQSAEGCAGFRNSDVYLVVDGGILRQCAAKIGKPIRHVQSLAFDDVRLNVLFPRGRLIQYFSFLCADGETELCAGGRGFVNADLLASF